MCLAIPAEVIEINETNAIANVGGVQRQVSLDLVDDVKPGDYVIVHVGYAIAKLNQQEAEKNLELFATMLDEK